MRLISKFMLAAVVVFVLIAPAGAEKDGHDEQITPLLLAVHDAPMPFTGSDGRTHLVYELWSTNFSSGDATVEQVEVSGDGTLLVDARRRRRSRRVSSPPDAAMRVPRSPPSGTSLLFVHVVLPTGATAPATLSHTRPRPRRRRAARTAGDDARGRRRRRRPPRAGRRSGRRCAVTATSPPTRAATPPVTRARRCPSTVGVRLAQRYAVDWEQLDADRRIYVGPRDDPKSYTIFGTEALAVADARVASVVDDLARADARHSSRRASRSRRPTATRSSSISVADASRSTRTSSRGSLKVRKGERVARGQVLGLVGNSGNSVAPHLHFHVMDGPSPLDSNGLPYAIDGVRGRRTLARAPPPSTPPRRTGRRWP